MIRFIAVALSIVSGPAAAFAPYTCELKARDNLMQPFETQIKEFDGERPIEIRVKSFKLQFSIVGGRDDEKPAIWLGVDDAHSAVTLGTLGQEMLYVNMVQGDLFAVAECRRVAVD